MIGDMRRLTTLLAALVLVAGPLATAGEAMARDQHGGHGGEQRGEQHGGGHGGGNRGGGGWMGGRSAPAPVFRGGGGEYRGDGRSERMDPRRDPRGEVRGEPRGDYRGEYREPRADPRYDPRGYAPPAAAYGAAPRRGGYLGPGSRGEVIQDYGRQRLRPPPPGYDWVQTGRGAALVSRSTGQVFDVVPY
jgi:Ni/Co efflux regulator RcnB